MKNLALLTLTLLCGSASAITINQNLPGLGVRDLTARSVIIEPDGQIYSSVPGMPNVRDISQPAYYIQGNTIYPEAIPGLKAQDFSEPSYSIEYDQ